MARGKEPSQSVGAPDSGIREPGSSDIAQGPRELIRTEGLTKTYGVGTIAVHALRGVDIQVRDGEFVAVMGPSGSGKSTLMNILGCLDRPSGGNYILDGANVSHLGKDRLASVRNQKIGFVFQAYNLLDRLSAVRNVMLPLLYQESPGVSDQEAHDRAVASLEAVGLGDRINHLPKEMSGGQQQRVAIARALITHPSIILADEPTGNLDTRTSNELMDLLEQLHAEGVTLVMVTHALDIAEHADRVIYLIDGLVVSDQTHASGIAELHNGHNGGTV